MSKLEKGQDYWYIQLYSTGVEIKADTYSGRDWGESWNRFPSRIEAERALAKIVLLLTEAEPTPPESINKE